MRDEYFATTRFADLDTQRHVTSRTYEAFALEGRYRLLAKLGYTQEKIQNEQIYLNPVSSYAKFHRQQFPGVELQVVTRAHFPDPPESPLIGETPTAPLPYKGRGLGWGSASEGLIHWDQKIFEKTGELVCHLQQQPQSVKAGEPFAIEGITAGNTESAAHTRSQPDTSSVQILYDNLKPWSGNNERVIGQYQLPYSDRDFAGKYNLASLWKIFEEGRWIFVEKVGLTYEKIVELDTTSFFMGSICNFYGDVPAGRMLQVMTWIERIDKIRYWFRQDVMHNGKVLISMRDEQLIVSLSRARPQRASEQFMRYLGKYVEYP
jgi:acyl-CoA thioesterase FadM